MLIILFYSCLSILLYIVFLLFFLYCIEHFIVPIFALVIWSYFVYLNVPTASIYLYNIIYIVLQNIVDYKSLVVLALQKVF